MGHKAEFRCFSCRYEELDLGIGHGRHQSPYLSLFRCDHCHSVGSTWVVKGSAARCSLCYSDEPTLLGEDTKAIDCPKCGQPGTITHKREEVWE